MKIIGISGKKQSGKTTAAEMFCKHLGPDKCFTVGFADALKEELIIAINAVNKLRNQEPITSHTIEQFKSNFRLLLQGWGTDFRRTMYGPSYWVNQLEEQLKKAELSGYKYAIIPDTRFMNELVFLRIKNAITIRIERLRFDIDNHSSEQDLASISNWDYTIENSMGLMELEVKIARIVKELPKT